MGWMEEDNKLKRDFEFDTFIQAFSFLTKVALVTEKANHHPEIHNVYNKVSLSLSTDDAGDIVTQKDRDLAVIIDKLT